MDCNVKHSTEGCRFTTEIDGHTAYVTYDRDKDCLDLTHTIVPRPIEGRGVAASLVKEALKYARENGLKIRPICSYTVAYFNRHPDEKDLLHDDYEYMK